MKHPAKPNPMTPEQIDALLPQTQCGLCDYDGCRPYAEAIAYRGERIDRCPPGGVRTLRKLAEHLGQDPAPMLPEMRTLQKPPMLAFIQEDACIGCTKCIQACPTDAILGARKTMHTVIAKDCTGCELCVPPCPVDCIEIHTLPERSDAETERNAKDWRTRYEARNLRLKRNTMLKAQKHRAAKAAGQREETDTQRARQAVIKAALERAKAKRKAQAG